MQLWLFFAVSTAAFPSVGHATVEEDIQERGEESCCGGTQPKNTLYCYSGCGQTSSANLNECRGSGGVCIDGALSGGGIYSCNCCECVGKIGLAIYILPRQELLWW